MEAWGGGGGGGRATGNPAKGGGGAGGQYARKVVTVVPGTVYAIGVGAGGAGGSGTNGGSGLGGGDSTFAATTVVAKGGTGGALGSVNGGTAAAGVGSTTGGVGDTVYAGGSGSDGVGAVQPAGIGGAGGGGAGSTGAGGSASGNTAGTGTAVGGGNGGAGRTSGGAGNAGAINGGGGGGGYALTATDRNGAAGARGQVTVTYTPATILADGANPANVARAPSGAITDLDSFTLRTSSGTDSVTALTVTLTGTNAFESLSEVRITNNGGGTTYFSAVANPASNTISFSGGTPIPVTATATTFKVRITPKTHANMPLPPGLSYDVGGTVTAFTSTNPQLGTDDASATVTVDNLSPAGATATSGTAGNASVTLDWTTSASADFNTTGGSVVYRWATTAGAEVPAEGSAPAVNNTNGTATVACVVSSAASTPLTRTNGTGGGSGCSTIALTNGTAYVYKVFQKDSNGNYDSGVTIGTFTPGVTTTLAASTDPAAATIAPGAAATDANRFTFDASSGTEAITSVTVDLSTNSGIGLLAITDNANTVLGSTASPVTGSNTIPLAITATTTLTTYKVRVTPLSHAAMPAPPGGAYAITAPVTAWAGPNIHVGSDTDANALTIDNLSPAGATATSGTASNASVTLNWTTSASADFDTTGGSVLYRWTTTAGAEVPAEGSAPVVNSTNGTATVACVISSAASTALTRIDGTGGSAGCSTTALAIGTTYVYKLFQKDNNGNYDSGVTIGSFTVNPIAPTAITNAASGVTSAVATLNGTVSSNSASTTVVFEYGLTAAYGETITATQSPLAADAVNAAVSADLIGLNCNTVFHYRVVATNSAGTSYGGDGTFTTGACSAPFPATACAATRFNNNLGCTASDVNLTSIALAPASIASCVSGTPVTLDLDLTINFSSPNRWDVGIFIANDGKLPTLLPVNGGANSCSVDILPTTAPFLDLDGVPQGTLDTCGDGNSSIDDSALPGGTVPLGDGVKRMTGVTLPCYASPASGGKLFVPFVVSWDNQKSPIGNLCTSNLYPVPNTSSRCNAPASSVSINVVVLPVVTKTNGGTIINVGANTTYTVVITNNSGGTLLDAIFTDPAVANLTVTGVSCAAAAGAICPTTTVAAMQDVTPVTGGIHIPSANLPNNGSLTFTINATLSGAAIPGNHLINTATVAIGTATTSATDDDLIVVAPSAAKSFAPSTITEGSASVLTVTLTNPTASAVTGVSFTDTYPAGVVNTAAAGGASSCGGTVTAANDGNSLALSGGTIPANGSCTVTVNITSAAAGSYFNSTGAIASDSGAIPAASATLTVDVAVFGAFNACDVAPVPNATCTNATTVTNSHIATKIAGIAFSLDIVALRTSGARNTGYGNDVLVELLDASDNSGPLDAYNCRSTWTTVIATLSPNPLFTGAANGLITVGTFTVANAYRDVRVRVTNVGGTAKKGCSTDNFAIRPNSLAVSVTDADWQTAGTARALANIGVTGGIVHKAGQPFTVTATALNAASATTTNYAGTPAAALSDCSPAGTACTASFGNFVLGAAGALSGVVTWNLAVYSEVGAFDLTMQDTDFASIDAADTAASCAGYYVCSAATPVGRFVPDHFDLSGSALINRSDINAGVGCSPASTFTYMGETMKTSFTLTAKNAVGSPTQNYAGSFAKFTNSIVNWIAGTGNDRVGLWAIATGYTYSGSTCKVLFDRVTPSVNSFAACSGAVPALPIGRAAGPRVTVSSPSISAWVGGAATFIADATLERGDMPDGSYATLNIGVTPQDADGVALSAYDLDADNSGTDERASLGTTEVRFGRLKLSNAHGSELLKLPVPVQAQYWNGAAFVPNEADDCTVLNSTHFALGNYQRKAGDTWTTSLTLASTAAILGAWQVNLSKPSPTPTGKGSVDLCVDLGADPGGGTVCSATASANLPYLQGLWSPGSSYNNDPKVRAAFGVFKGNEEFIYLREMY